MANRTATSEELCGGNDRSRRHGRSQDGRPMFQSGDGRDRERPRPLQKQQYGRHDRRPYSYRNSPNNDDRRRHERFQDRRAMFHSRDERDKGRPRSLQNQQYDRHDRRPYSYERSPHFDDRRRSFFNSEQISRMETQSTFYESSSEKYHGRSPYSTEDRQTRSLYQEEESREERTNTFSYSSNIAQDFEWRSTESSREKQGNPQNRLASSNIGNNPISQNSSRLSLRNERYPTGQKEEFPKHTTRHPRYVSRVGLIQDAHRNPYQDYGHNSELELETEHSRKRPNHFEDVRKHKRPKCDNEDEASLIGGGQNSNFEDLKIQLFKMKDKTPHKILQELVCIIKELGIYLEQTKNLDVSHLIPTIASALDSNGSERDTESLRNLLATSKLLGRTEILSYLAVIVMNANSSKSLKQEEGLFISSLLSLIPKICNDYDVGSIKPYLDLVRAILMRQRDSIDIVDTHGINKVFELLEKAENAVENVVHKVESTSHCLTQADRAKLETLSTAQILPVDMIEMHYDCAIPVHESTKPFRNDVDYLQMMFTLYREDFFKPLRRGLHNYMTHIRTNQTSNFRDDDVRVYTDIRLGEKRCNNEMGLIQDVHFVGRTSGNSILQFGNLVCFTNTEFEFINFAMVAFRDVCMLKEGMTSVLMIQSDTERLYNKNIVMIETKAFYTAYAHTLKAIRNIASDLFENYQRLPFSDQLVYLEKLTKEPEYTKDIFGGSKRVSFQCLLKNDTEILESLISQENGNFPKESPGLPYDNVPLLEMNAWPTQEQLGLDSSQYEALKHAFTTKLAIIQGPPGTGKTVMGLKIVNLLLSNRHLLQQRKPIVLVSYTNHALDQFLNGVFGFSCMSAVRPRDLIRVGSRSDHERLKAYNLKNRLRELRQECDALFLRKRLFRIRREIDQERENTKEIEEGILHEDFLYKRGILTWSQHASMQRNFGEENVMGSVIISWLGIKDMFEENVQQNVNLDQFEHDAVDEEILREEDSSRMMDFEDDDFDSLYRNDMNNTRHKEQTTVMALSMEIIKDHNNLPKVWQKLSEPQLCQIMTYVISEVKIYDRMDYTTARDVYDVWKLDFPQRWRLYRYWVFLLNEPYIDTIQNLQHEFKRTQSDYESAMEDETLEIFKRAKIIAFTTTGAAKYNEILRGLAPSVVVVEEAAHMSEQHILGCITSSTEHLILIGDHLQLKPQANDYKLSQSHAILECSMLERLVTSGVEFRRLSCQHRMSREISNFICPKFYRNLKDHESVTMFGNIKGVARNIIFLDHNEHETKSQFSHSYCNHHEAHFLTRLYKYLRQQGYSYKDITILSLYNEQVRLIRKLVRKVETEDSILARDHKEIDEYSNKENKIDRRTHRGVHVIAVDNFQGEENKIILLSLVRSNTEGITGYLKNQNRMCVALTRAKLGLYVVGNLSMIRKNHNWNSIVEEAERQGIYAKVMELCCQTHPEAITSVRKASDFDKVPDGGCNRPCDFQRPCGHTCGSKCHLKDDIHNMPCMKQCRRKLCALEHRCPKLCSEPCGVCREKVQKVITSCGHQIELECHQNPDKTNCKMQCEKKLTCGHQCQRKCGQNCNTEENCNELIKLTPECGHEIQIACSQKRFPVCKVPCKEILACGHKCSGSCGRCSNGRLHIPCKENCSRILICGHTCKSKCSKVCPPCQLPCKRSCFHLRKGCTRKCGQSCIACREPCTWKCAKGCTNNYVCTKDCYEECNRPRCNNPCKKRHSKCRHLCCGICGEPCPSLCNICHKNKLTEIFFGTEEDEDARFVELQDCLHIFEVTGMDQYIDGLSNQSDENAIVEISCPRCKTPIKKSYRYGNAIKCVLKDIDKVKQIQNQKEQPGTCLQLQNTRDMVVTLGTKHELDKLFHFVFAEIVKFLTSESKRKRGFHHSMKTAELIDLLIKFFKKAMDSSLKSDDASCKTIQKHFLAILKWLCIERFSYSDFEIEQFYEEVNRFSLLTDFLVLQHDIGERLETDVTEDEKRSITEILQSLLSPQGKVDKDAIRKVLETLREKIPIGGLGISDDEKAMVLKAMGFQQKGHWYKCKNGHIYAIGECGGAMESRKCPECSDTIGGSSHRLTDSNTVATEMDGAKYSAWSEQANMGNYQL